MGVLLRRHENLCDNDLKNYIFDQKSTIFIN